MMPDFNEIERNMELPEFPDEIQTTAKFESSPEQIELIAAKIEAAEKQIAALTRSRTP